LAGHVQLRIPVNTLHSFGTSQGEVSSLSLGFDDREADAEVDLDGLRGRLDVAGLLVSAASSLPEGICSLRKAAAASVPVRT
jgi:hypothetical protein